MYLQNLYRFFRLFSVRSEFADPFSAKHFLFFSSRLFAVASLAPNFGEVATFMMNRKMYSDTADVLNNQPKGQGDYYYHMLMGRLLMLVPQKFDDEALASHHFQQALVLQPESESAKRGLGRAYFHEEAYEQAYGVYAELMQQYEENNSYKLYAATCLTNLKRYDEAQKLLYMLNYNDANDQRVNRVLAWTLRETRKYEQAAAIYEKLCAKDDMAQEDVLNYGYCMWFRGDVQKAITLLKNAFDADTLSMAFSRDEQLLEKHGISKLELQLMLDEML
jgi:tetratricopeptide (TPR) repeat protein